MCMVGYTGYQALKAKDALELVAADFERLSEQLKSGDGAAARETLDSVQVAAEEARVNTRGPGWWLTSYLPGVGDDVIAVRTVADVTDALASDVLPSVVTASEILEPSALRPVKGRVDLEPIAQVAPAVTAADTELQRHADRVAGLQTGKLNPALADPVELMQTKLAEAAALSEKASYAVRLLPSMMGSEGKRSYLMLFQNNAEIRATGGIPGAFAVVTADDGRIKMGAQGDAAGIGRFDKPPLDLTREEVALFQQKMGLFAQNINFTPDFPRTAELAKAMWESAGGQEVDGVLSADPVALSYLLEGTGPVETPIGQELTADNAVQLLLNEVYLDVPDPEQQNELFAAAARNVFDAVAAGRGEPRQALEGLSRAAGERRLLAWSNVPDEQALLEETKLSGAIPTEPTQNPFVGVYFNDGTGAKMQYYFRHNVSIKPLGCQDDGSQKLQVTVTMRSVAPADAAGLPVSVIGPGFGAEPGAIRTTMYLYAPLAGRIESSTVDGEDRPLAEFEHLGHVVGARTVDLDPGQTRKLEFTVETGPDQTGQVDLRVTPGVHGTGVGRVSSPTC